MLPTILDSGEADCSFSLQRGAESPPIVKVYGNDWRVTEPVRINELPQYVPRAFLAAGGLGSVLRRIFGWRTP